MLLVEYFGEFTGGDFRNVKTWPFLSSFKIAWRYNPFPRYAFLWNSGAQARFHVLPTNKFFLTLSLAIRMTQIL
jgi:hypothetical protein